MIKRVKIFTNNNQNSHEVRTTVETALGVNGFKLVKDNNKFDLGIAIGGDGSFLRMIKNNKFNSEPYYIGINAGTLGFLQEVNVEDLEKFIDEIKSNRYNSVDNIGIQETSIECEYGSFNFYSLNEILIKDEKSKKLELDINVDGSFLERFTGDGVLIATSTGSTAHNLSYGGAIVYPTFSTLQITPLGPISTKAYRTLSNSIIIPDYKEIGVKPKNRSLLITIDGEDYIYKDIDNIKTSIKDKKIKCLRLRDHNFFQKVNEKLL